MPKYIHDRWGTDKHYYVAHNGIGGYTIKQFEKGCLKTELRITSAEKTAFEEKLKSNGWYENANNRLPYGSDSSSSRKVQS